MLTGGGLLDCRSLAEEVPMNKELMNDENFIRCSTMIAELLMKYKNKEYEARACCKNEKYCSRPKFVEKEGPERGPGGNC